MRHAVRPFDGVHRQCDAEARRGCGASFEHPSRQGQGWPFQRRRGDGRGAGKRPRQGRVRAAVDLLAAERLPDGSAGAGGRAEARVGIARDGGDPVYGICAPGPAAEFGAGTDHVEGGCEHAGVGRRQPGVDDGSAFGADSGLFRYPGRQYLLGADTARRHLEARLQEPGRGVAGRRRRGARAGAREAARVRPRDHRQAASAAERGHRDEHHRRRRRAHLRDRR